MPRLCQPNVLSARTLGTLALFKRDGLSFSQHLEGRIHTRRLVEEVFRSVRSLDEAKPLVADETFHRTLQSSHGNSVEDRTFVGARRRSPIFPNCWLRAE